MNSDLKKALDSMPGVKQTNISENMTSAGRLDKMLSSDSPLMKRAATQGKQQAQSRGLLNSSMAAGASQGAMIDRAQPFAMQDSNNLIQNAERNTDAQNQRGLLQAGLIGDSYKSNQNYEQQLGLNEQAYGFESQLANQQQNFQQGNMRLASELERDINEQQANFQAQRDERLAGFDQSMARLGAELQEAQARNDFGRAQQLESQRAQIQQDRDDLLFEQQEQSARNELGREMERMGYAFELDQKSVSKAFSSSIAERTLQNVQSIQADPNLDPEAKRNAVQNAMDMANQTMAWGSTFYNTPMPSISAPQPRSAASSANNAASPSVSQQRSSTQISSSTSPSVRSTYEDSMGNWGGR